MSEHDDLRRSWIENASAWRDAVREQRIDSRRLVTDAAIVAAVLEQTPRRVLDVGCGEGWLGRALAAHGVAVTGIDASLPLIEEARALGGGEFLHVGYEELDRTRLGEDFDVIVANFSLLDDRTAELLRALPGGATLLVQTIHPAFAGGEYADGWRTETFAKMPGEWREPMPWYFRTLESWTRTFASAGYQIAEIREPRSPGAAAPSSIIFRCGSPTRSSR